MHHLQSSKPMFSVTVAVSNSSPSVTYSWVCSQHGGSGLLICYMRSLPAS